MILNVSHAQSAKTAAALQEHATGLKQSIERMKQELEPLYKNWYQSNSPTGDKVHKRELLIDEAMKVITAQMSGSGTVIADFSKSLSSADTRLA